MSTDQLLDAHCRVHRDQGGGKGMSNAALDDLIERKMHTHDDSGFAPVFMPSMLFDFQKALIEWSVRKGRAAIFADCGLGKSAMEMTFAQNVVEKTNGRVLVLTPLAVAPQMVAEAAKFGIEAERSSDGKAAGKIVVANYERLHHFDPADFVGLVCDESSILKNCDGVTRAAVTDFARKMSYRLLCTATPSPNDLIELGTSSEALGYMGFNDMLSTFFKKDADRKTNSRKDEFRSGVWRFRGHAEQHFFMWVCAWARAVRKPSDIGFSDDRFKLPELITRETVVSLETPLNGMLFTMPAVGLHEQRQERRSTIEKRCEAAANAINAHSEPAVAWCYLNDESAGLKASIPGAVEVSGSDTMEEKEEALIGFAKGQIRVLVTKPEIAGFGLNWQHCAHQTFFPSHSFEQYHQAIRRSWRFGQKRPVTVDIITSEGETGVLASLLRKSEQADRLFANLVSLMGEANTFKQSTSGSVKTALPSWL